LGGELGETIYQGGMGVPPGQQGASEKTNLSKRKIFNKTVTNKMGKTKGGFGKKGKKFFPFSGDGQNEYYRSGTPPWGCEEKPSGWGRSRGKKRKGPLVSSETNNKGGKKERQVQVLSREQVASKALDARLFKKKRSIRKKKKKEKKKDRFSDSVKRKGKKKKRWTNFGVCQSKEIRTKGGKAHRPWVYTPAGG